MQLRTRPTRSSLAVLATVLLLCVDAHAGPLSKVASSTVAGLVGSHSLKTQRGVLSLLVPSVAAGRADDLRAAQPAPLDRPRALAASLNEFRDRFSTGPVALNAHPGSQFNIRMQHNNDLVDPKVVETVKNFRRNGLPLVHLWESKENLVSLGLNSHGVPGIWFTQKLPQ